jgi:hypothetical protein
MSGIELRKGPKRILARFGNLIQVISVTTYTFLNAAPEASE